MKIHDMKPKTIVFCEPFGDFPSILVSPIITYEIRYFSIHLVVLSNVIFKCLNQYNHGS